MQKWDYCYIYRNRGWQARPVNEGYHTAGEWTCKLFSASHNGDWPYRGFQEALLDLGRSGWELVTVSPRSSYLGGYHFDSIGGATSIAQATDYAGYTSEEMWVFKRPLE